VSADLMRRAGLVSFLAALGGLGASAYLSVEHYRSPETLACPDTGAINCAKVTTSAWSQIGPVPVVLLGLAFFIVATILCSPPAWRSRRLDPVRAVMAVAGVIGALYFVWVELYRIDAICLWCTAVHLCSFVLLGAVLWTTNSVRDAPAVRH
jgi:uncharacterized membrane protein